MWKVGEIICLAILSGVAAGDILFKKVPTDFLVISGGSAVVYQLVTGENSLPSIMGGFLVGAVFIFLSKVTQEKIGLGDSIGILILGIFLGLRDLLSVLAGAFLLVFLTTVILLSVRKMSRKVSIPFYPFLAVSYLFFIW